MIVGVDLGTTNTGIAFLDGDTARIIPNDRGNRITPSVIAFDENGEALVGEPARNYASTHPDRTVFGVKRLMGDTLTIAFGSVQRTPEQISACIIRKVCDDAQAYLGERIRAAVIAVPAHFSDRARVATIDAGRLAGLSEVHLINEPTAAAIAYANDSPRKRNIVVYDLGGGTFDVTCLESKNNDYTVRSSRGKADLGGRTFDSIMRTHVVEKLETEIGRPLRDDPIVSHHLEESIERAKIELSSRETTGIAVPFVSASGRAMHLECEITRAQFDHLIRSRLEETIRLIRLAVQEAGFDRNGSDTLVYSGGSCRIPIVQSLVHAAIRAPEQYMANPDEIVALGAAVYAERFLRRNASRTAARRTATEGARLRDVAAFNLGVELDDGRYVPVLPRNTPIPATRTRTVTTVSDNQSAVQIHVLQGDDGTAENNHSLGRFVLSGIQKAARGEPRIDVVFSIDENGITHIAARDAKTRAVQKIVVAPHRTGTDKKSDHDRVVALIRDVRVLLEKTRVDADFERECATVIADAEKAVSSKDPTYLAELGVALETVLLELTTILESEEARFEGA
ncbi:MAG: heat-shock protein Hsp70 [Spirochaetaceae bacterium]|nr:MAG: heat-shock protein Hsp70 [Spirochaetaceae bacterium]